MPCMSYDTNWAKSSSDRDVKALKKEADKLARIEKGLHMKAVGWIEGDGIHWLGDRRPEPDTTLFVQTPEPDPAELGEPIGYTLEPIYAPRRGFVTTQAFVLCSSCGSAISSSGGPRYNAVCLKCIDRLDLINKLKQ